MSNFAKMLKATGASLVGGEAILFDGTKHHSLGHLIAGEFHPTPYGQELMEKVESGELKAAIAEGTASGAAADAASSFDHDGDGRPGGAPPGGNKRGKGKAKAAAEPEPAPPAPAEGELATADTASDEGNTGSTHDVTVADEPVEVADSAPANTSEDSAEAEIDAALTAGLDEVDALLNEG